MVRERGSVACRLRARDARRDPRGRVGRVDDIAPALVFLASPTAGYVHGASLLVDGGCAAA